VSRATCHPTPPPIPLSADPTNDSPTTNQQATLAAAQSNVRAASDVGKATAVEQSVEWLSGRRFRDTVSYVEQMYFSRNPPPKGGTLISARQPYGDAITDATGMQVAHLRPDDVHSTVLAAVVRINRGARCSYARCVAPAGGHSRLVAVITPAATGNA
jgi:hypothetical protein